ncbi:MAG: hypothetical protein IIY77_06905 [Lachnospiraceae bacterium]|nr:hypothetical protein [Lachnospiraceae bacterium]
MFELTPKKLTVEDFKPYGEFRDLLGVSEAPGFFPDLIQLNFGTTTLPSIDVCRVKKADENIIRFVEYHSYTCEGLIPLDGDVVIYVGKPARGFKAPTGEDLEAYILPKGTFVRFKPGVLHGTQYPIDKEFVNLICMLPERTYANDCQFIRFDDDAAAKVIM